MPADEVLPLFAVITADIVRSRNLPAKDLETRASKIAEAIEATCFKGEKTFEFYRGDSFQASLSQPEEALRIALLWRAAMKASITDDMQWDIRVAIGIGQVDHHGKTLAASGGPAFQHSGTLLDAIKRNGESKIAFHTDDPNWTAALMTECILAEGIISRWTATGADTIYRQLLFGDTQEGLAARFGVTQSAIHKRLQAGGWPAIRHWEAHYRQSSVQYINRTISQ